MSTPSTITQRDDASRVLKYLGLPETYEPSPVTAPLAFLQGNIRVLPSHLLVVFSDLIPPQRRSTIPTIRNRRLNYLSSNPAEFKLAAAKGRWPTLWKGRGRPGQERGTEEKEWAEKEFMAGRGQVGKLGSLLRDYEEEREGERVRGLRREQAEQEAIVEEEEDSEDDEPDPDVPEEETVEEAQDTFLRLVKERFIYGILHVGASIRYINRRSLLRAADGI